MKSSNGRSVGIGEARTPAEIGLLRKNHSRSFEAQSLPQPVITGAPQFSSAGVRVCASPLKN